MEIVFDDGSKKTIQHHGTLTFSQFVQEFFKCSIFVLSGDSKPGNLAIDTTKVKWLELL